MLFRLLREPPARAVNRYIDVPDGAWYEPYVSALTALGIVQGTGNERFEPDAPITRAEFAAMTARLCTAAVAAPEFPDLAPDHWAYAHAATACAGGWMSADASGGFRPDDTLTRGEAVQSINVLLGRTPDPEALEASGPPPFADLSPGDPWYYDVWDAALPL